MPRRPPSRRPLPRDPARVTGDDLQTSLIGVLLLTLVGILITLAVAHAPVTGALLPLSPDDSAERRWPGIQALFDRELLASTRTALDTGSGS